MFEIVDVRRTDDGRTYDGRTPEHGYTISSPCEPKGSGELKKNAVCIKVLTHQKPSRFFFMSVNGET